MGTGAELRRSDSTAMRRVHARQFLGLKTAVYPNHRLTSHVKSLIGATPGASVYARAILSWLLALALSACALGVPRLPAEGNVGGQHVEASVDSPLARYYLEDYLAGRRSSPAFDAQLELLHEESDLVFSNNHHVQTLSREYSVDTLALFFASRLLEQPQNKDLQQAFNQQLETLQAAHPSRPRPSQPHQQRYRVVFVPGWLYRSKPWTGADFAAPRAILDRQGVETHLIEVTDNGTIENNAAIVAQALLPLLEDGKPVIVISGSKGSPELAVALGQLLTPEQLKPVHAWINICGALEGSPLADIWTSWPSSWLSWTMFQLRGYGGLEGLKSMRTARSQQRSKSLHIPSHILVVNYVGVPVSGTIIKKEFEKRFTYSQLRDYGPNDGLVLIPDEIAPDSITITEVGRGHFLSEPDFDVRTAALLWTIIERLESDGPKPATNLSSSHRP